MSAREQVECRARSGRRAMRLAAGLATPEVTGGNVPHSIYERQLLARADKRRPAHVMPLSEFPEEMRLGIIAATLQPKPPPRWLMVCDGLAQLESRAWHEWHWARGKRPPLPTWARKAVIERDGYVCGLCGGEVEPSDVHIDHIVPRSRGGPDAIENLQVAHSRCNIRKGARV